MENNNTCSFNLSKSHHKSKPTKKQVPKLSIELEHGQQIGVDINLLKERIEEGYTFTPALINTPYNGVLSRIQECWTNQQIFGIDIDDISDDKELIDKCIRLGIKPFLVYRSFSWKPNKPKYRLLFKTNEPVTDYRVAKVVLMALMNIFDESDKSCKDLSRLFFGTKFKSSFYNSDYVLDLANLFTRLEEKFIKDTKNGSSKQTTFCKNTGCLGIINNRFAITDNKELLLGSNFDIVSFNNLYFGFAVSEDEVKYRKTTNKVTDCEKYKPAKIKVNNDFKMIDHFDFCKLYDRCQLWRMFCDAEEKVEYPQLVRIMMNIIHAKGGEDKFLTILTNVMEEQPALYDTPLVDKIGKMQSCMKSFRRQNYKPASCDGTSSLDACPFCEECHHGANMLVTTEVQKNEIVVLSQTNKHDIKDRVQAEAMLNNLITSAYGTIGLHFIQSPVGLGKTEEYLKLAKSGDVIATPNHDLCLDVCRRLRNKGKDFVYLYRRPPLIESDQQTYDKLLKIGAIQQAKAYYHDKVAQYNEKENTYLYQAYTNIIDECNKFIALEKEIKDCDKIIVCTHAKLPFVLDSNSNIKTVFLDESIDDTLLFKVDDISRADIATLLKLLPENNVSEFGRLVERINHNVNQNKVVIREHLLLNSQDKKSVLDVICKNKHRFSSAVSNILESSLVIVPNYEKKNSDGMAVCNTISAIKVNTDFFKQYPMVNFINVSATFHQGIIRQLFGQAVQSIKYIKESNQIRLYHNNTCSKQNLSKLLKDDEWINYLRNVIGNIPVITFKKLKKEFGELGFNADEEMHFWKCVGIDKLSGKDIAIVGTPHFNEHKYLYLGAVLGYDISNTQKNRQEVEYNGYRFNFYTYTNNQFLRELQLYCIDSQLCQAIGRARTIRTNAIVHVFSNFPVQGATLMEMGEVK